MKSSIKEVKSNGDRVSGVQLSDGVIFILIRLIWMLIFLYLEQGSVQELKF
jgi:hypothetical protein